MFVSMTGSGRFRANAQMAEAVYGPIPGSLSNSSLECGSSPCNVSVMIFAHACNLRALELNPSPDRCFSRSILERLASAS